MESIKRAIALMGGAEKAASALGVSKASVYFWMKGERGLPAELCPSIERATSGAVRCEELRPDVAWDVLRDAAAAPVAMDAGRVDRDGQPPVEVDADGTPFVRTDFRTHADGRQSEQHETHAVEPKAAA